MVHRSPTSRAGVVLGIAGLLVRTMAGCGNEEAGSGAAEESAYYEGKSVDLVVPYDPGGGYDVYARAVAPYIAECLGAPAVVRNEPGAGGLLATNATAVAGPDDLRLQILNTAGFAAAQIAKADGVQFDLAELSHVGRISSAPSALVVADDGGIATFEDISGSTDPVRFVATGPGSEGYIVASVLAAAYDFPLEVVTGFAGSGEARNAVVAGNAEVLALAFDSLLGPIEAGEVRPVVLVDETENELLPDAPLITEFDAPGEEARDLIDSLVTLGASGRSIAAPPGLPEERLTELREAFACALGDEELLAELESQQRPVDVIGGAEYADLLQELLDASAEFESAIKDSF
jgi:tripartite-type tricarboxylate transporter receptor subunit TctC